MLHDVMTAAKGGELVSAQLPVYAGEKRVRAAKIVAVGLGAQLGQTRLALAGGAHVEVGKAWMQKTGAHAGQYYVQGPNDVNETIEGDEFETAYAPAEEQDEPVTSGWGIAHYPKQSVAELREELVSLQHAVTTLTHERDGARARITELEKELADRPQLTGIEPDPSAEDLDRMADEMKAREATKAGDGETQTESE